MEPKEYLDKRVEDQINWYDKKSKRNQIAFKSLRFSEIIVAAFIPLLSGLLTSYPDYEKIGMLIVGILGVILSIIAGTLGLGQFQERWIEYRTTCESLKKEKFLFETGVEPFDGKNPFALLVQRVETLVSKENTNWAQYMMKPDKGKNE